MLFRDPADAGRALALRLSRRAHRLDVSVLARPRGGVPVGDFAQTRAEEVRALLRRARRPEYAAADRRGGS
jgi:predicted phosphoribosyltransferase